MTTEGQDGRTIVPDKAHRRDDPGTGDGDSGTRRPRPRELSSLSPPGRSSLVERAERAERAGPVYAQPHTGAGNADHPDTNKVTDISPSPRGLRGASLKFPGTY